MRSVGGTGGMLIPVRTKLPRDIAPEGCYLTTRNAGQEWRERGGSDDDEI